MKYVDSKSSAAFLTSSTPTASKLGKLKMLALCQFTLT